LNLGDRVLAAIAQPEEFQRVIVDFEGVGLGKFLFKMMHGAFIDRDRKPTSQTGEVMAVFLDRGVERFARGLGADLDESGFFQRIEGAIDRREAHRLTVRSQFDVEILRRNRIRTSLQADENAILATGAAGFHAMRA
jgi:hypothetical protein